MKNTQHPDAVIIGAGLAGLSAAIRLADAGLKVMILEDRAVMGGRTASWYAGEMEVESGLHRWLGIYTALPKLVEHIGLRVDDIVQWEDAFDVMSPELADGKFIMAPLFRPAGSIDTAVRGGGFLGAEDMKQAWQFIRLGMTQLLRNPTDLDQKTVGDIYVEAKCDSQPLMRLLLALCDGIFFMPPSQFSAYCFFQLLTHGLQRGLKMRVGSFTGGMTRVLIDPMARYVESRGGEIVLDAKVHEVLRMPENDYIHVEHKWGEIQTNNIVIATNMSASKHILERCIHEEPWFEPFTRLNPVPVISVQIELEKPALDFDRVVFAPHTHLACLAEQSRVTFRQSSGRLSIIMSDSGSLLKASEDEILRLVRSDFKKLGFKLPKMRHMRVVRHLEDFYAMAPGNETLRPPQRTPVKGLYLAGDYTKQSYFATMEGAVVSGNFAAEALLADRKKKGQQHKSPARTGLL